MPEPIYNMETTSDFRSANGYEYEDLSTDTGPMDEDPVPMDEDTISETTPRKAPVLEIQLKSPESPVPSDTPINTGSDENAVEDDASDDSVCLPRKLEFEDE